MSIAPCRPHTPRQRGYRSALTTYPSAVPGVGPEAVDLRHQQQDRLYVGGEPAGAALPVGELEGHGKNGDRWQVTGGVRCKFTCHLPPVTCRSSFHHLRQFLQDERRVFDQRAQDPRQQHSQQRGAERRAEQGRAAAESMVPGGLVLVHLDVGVRDGCRPARRAPSAAAPK